MTQYIGNPNYYRDCLEYTQTPVTVLSEESRLKLSKAVQTALREDQHQRAAVQTKGHKSRTIPSAKSKAVPPFLKNLVKQISK